MLSFIVGSRCSVRACIVCVFHPRHTALHYTTLQGDEEPPGEAAAGLSEVPGRPRGKVVPVYRGSGVYGTRVVLCPCRTRTQGRRVAWMLAAIVAQFNCNAAFQPRVCRVCKHSSWMFVVGVVRHCVSFCCFRSAIWTFVVCALMRRRATRSQTQLLWHPGNTWRSTGSI